MPSASKQTIVEDARKLRDKLERAVELKAKKDNKLQQTLQDLAAQKQVSFTNQNKIQYIIIT